jgi:uncharacterized protein (DUF924 family)
VKASQRRALWFQSRRDTDETIARRFAPTLKAAAQGALADWETQPRSTLALIIVLDQFPRNMHRGTAAAFEHDARALGVTRRGVAAGFLRPLSTVEQAFFLMPFQHCEDLSCQREGLELFQRMMDEAPAEWRTLAEGMLRSAGKHLEIVQRFGRFPHRNAILGRPSTPSELEYLQSNSESFGQSSA